MVSTLEANKLSETESTHRGIKLQKRTNTNHMIAIYIGTKVYAKQHIHTHRHRDEENARLIRDPSIP